MESKDIFYIIIGIIFIVVILIITIFSSISLITLICNWNSHCRSISNLLIINSSTTFLFFVITISIQIPYLFQSNENQTTIIPIKFCQVHACLFLFACIVKVYSYVIQAISRFFITILYKHKNLLTYRINKFMIIISWIVSLMISTGMLISPVSFEYETESRLCLLTSKHFHTSFTLMVVAYLIPVNIIIILYGIILWYTTRPNRVHPNNITIGNNKRNIKVFQKILLLLAIVIIGGIPYLLAVIINKIATTPWPLYSISILFITLSAATESLTIFLTNKDIKTIFYAKIPFCRKREILAVTILPATNGLSNQIRTNRTLTMSVKT